MALADRPGELDWADPGPKELVRAATFISEEGQDIHDGLGGSSQFDLERAAFVHFRPYLQLEQQLRLCLPTTLRIEAEETASWEDMLEQVQKMETTYRGRKSGFWHSIWHKAGENRGEIEGWVVLIPDTCGLAVVKVGLAVVFKLAEHSAEKCRKISDTFEALRDVLDGVDPKRTSFSTNKKVRESGDQLYQGIVDAIKDMIVLLSPEKPERPDEDGTTKRKFNLIKRRPKRPDPEEILQRLQQQIKDFQRALGIARDKAIENTEVMTQANGAQTYLARRDLKVAKDNTEGLKTSMKEHGGKLTKMDGRLGEMHRDVEHIASHGNKAAKEMRRMRENTKRTDQRIANIENMVSRALGQRNVIAEREMALQDDQLESRNGVLALLMEQQKNIAILQQRLARQQKRGAVVSRDRFCQILAQPSWMDGEPPDLEHMFQHPNTDLEQALLQKGRFKPSVQGQVQSLLRHKRLPEWLNPHSPDLLLVDANLRSGGLERLSAVSVFCATFITGMIKVRPEDIIVHFFCGQHVAPRDPWNGPNGLVRSLIMQLLMNLVDLKRLSLDFIDDRGFLSDLEDHDLPALCDALYYIVSQFPADTMVYVIIDHISAFDTEALFADLTLVLEYLQDMVEDANLAPVFKVLLTNPMQSTRRMKELSMFDEQDRIVTLSPMNSVPLQINSLAVENQLLRPATPTPSLSSGGRSRAGSTTSF
ncbi:hypothetical protein BJX68DRAFT_136213 [Aspergillus pseudodeflectus]|uniref:Uncharacterized protein n=1 Tax=Aspergillus pseudodeflectus TaxID=176178 RepID=A0ABR4JYJ3_9EURO